MGLESSMELESSFESVSSVGSKKRFIIYICFVVLILAFIICIAHLNDVNTVRLPILMYHHVVDGGDPASSISAEMFESHMKALSTAGYTVVSFEDLRDYVEIGTPLPDRPIVLTFDDGYMSVYDSAFPVLRDYGMKATVFVIGVFYGESVYKGANYLQITPHFGDVEVADMVASGLVSIQSHSYDMHQFEPYEAGIPRKGILRRSDESKKEYIEAFAADYALAADQIENAAGARPFVYSYPFGRRTRQAERLLKEAGIDVTVITTADFGVVIRGAPGSLYNLGRFNVRGDMSAEELLAMIAP